MYAKLSGKHMMKIGYLHSIQLSLHKGFVNRKGKHFIDKHSSRYLSQVIKVNSTMRPDLIH